jgi:dUTP pyrophosphatase
MEALQIRIKRVPGCEDIPLPRRMTDRSAGFDLHAAVDGPLSLGPGEIRLIPCGFHIAVPPGYEAQVRPRSGLAARHGITLVNTPGTIDSDYRGQVMCPVINLGHEPFTIERGMRIAQMVIAAVPAVQLLEVQELDDTARGEGGFGHTGT